jgi:hypothetical protein
MLRATLLLAVVAYASAVELNGANFEGKQPPVPPQQPPGVIFTVFTAAADAIVPTISLALPPLAATAWSATSLARPAHALANDLYDST